MGMGGYLWIINATSRLLKLTHQQSFQMNAWEFKSVSQQTMEKFYIEYNEQIFKIHSNDRGDATFQLDGTDDSFHLLARYPYKTGECGLTVDWNGMKSQQKYAVFPPPDKTIGELGWLHNGCLSLLIMEKGIKNSVSTVFPGTDSIVSAEKTLPYPQTFLYERWMGYYSDILARLTLLDMTFPGTHDSGTYNPRCGLLKLWIQTQCLPLIQQLQLGVRVLDLRTGQTSPGEYFIVHSAYRTSYTLAQALKDVTDFVDATEKEIVILDFHRFVKLGAKPYDYDQLKAQIRSLLKGYVLSYQNGHGKLLGEIWRGCGKGRVVVAWNTRDPDCYMWAGVDQRWYENADTKLKLYNAIKQDVLNPPSAGLWAACSFQENTVLHPPVKNARDTDPTITRWYFGGSRFSEKTNIISVDFFHQHSNVVQASIIASLLKAGAK